ncbi:AAA family ATPase [Candidatus Nomurabacteria bacterium]|nr:AAA family ATPase [Candidatus Nomurabacteria bacterium]
MRLKTLELNGFKSFAQKTVLEFDEAIVAVVGPNGSGKSNVVEAIRYVLGEQSMKSMRGKSGSDLIFKGSKTLPKASKASVAIYFDNSDKIFKLGGSDGENINLNYETIAISREVFSDDLNKYILNGSEVRLKDIHNLLASVNIGSSGHHIISQGEADRILNANITLRREMVEDALGLKIYQYKIKDSARKLERTEENMKEATLLRRENAPHLNFLRKQVEKFEKGKAMQAELLALYREYLYKESVFLEKEKENLKGEKEKIGHELKILAGKISYSGGESQKGNKKIEELRTAEKKINEIQGQRGELERKLGRIEGMIEAKESRFRIGNICPTCGRELRDIKNDGLETAANSEKEVAELKNSQASILAEMTRIGSEEKSLAGAIEKLKEDLNKEAEALRDLEREKFTYRVRHQELTSALELVNIKETNLKARMENFANEIKEGVALVGQDILSYKNQSADALLPQDGGSKASATTQEELKKKIDRIKIKLEDAGLGSGAEIMKEYKETSERDAFLERELDDLAKSLEALKKLIADLKEKIDQEFKEGVKKINVEFQEFFSLMFGGGTGALSIVLPKKKNRREKVEPLESARFDFEEPEEDVPEEEGIEINVSLPHKKVKELHALSGGERSLTSIALLFAMSQVNPPPFLVLDETDAALDEANSRKYGDMLEKLSKHSELIVVTHNRETMSRAGVLYGVTVGSNGASKLLSVKFEEATQIAK